jgi:hypothetical protein
MFVRVQSSNGPGNGLEVGLRVGLEVGLRVGLEVGLKVGLRVGLGQKWTDLDGFSEKHRKNTTFVSY